MTTKYSVEPNGSHWVISYETDDGENGYVCSVAEQIVAYTFAAAFQMKEALIDMTNQVDYLAPEFFDDDEHKTGFNARLEKANAAIDAAKPKTED